MVVSIVDQDGPQPEHPACVLIGQVEEEKRNGGIPTVKLINDYNEE